MVRELKGKNAVHAQQAMMLTIDSQTGRSVNRPRREKRSSSRESMESTLMEASVKEG